MKAMKRIALILVFLVLASSLVGGVGWAAQNTVTFEWEQPGDVSDLAGWKLWVSDTAGGPYNDGQTYLRDASGNPIDSVDIPYGGTPGASYTSDGVTIVVPDGAATTLCFVVNAWDTAGNPSGDSNEVCEPFDFLGPDNPINFRIKVKTRP